MPCSRCGARFKEDPSCGKTEHSSLPSRGIQDQDPRQPHPAANSAMVKLVAQVLVGEYFHELWLFTKANLEGEDTDEGVVIYCASQWGESSTDRDGEPWTEEERKFGPFEYGQWISYLREFVTEVGQIKIIGPEHIEDMIGLGYAG